MQLPTSKLEKQHGIKSEFWQETGKTVHLDNWRSLIKEIQKYKQSVWKHKEKGSIQRHEQGSVLALGLQE